MKSTFLLISMTQGALDESSMKDYVGWLVSLNWPI